MKRLSDNWITSGWIDVEYKKYILLDYLQQHETLYANNEVFPFLNDLKHHLTLLNKHYKELNTTYAEKDYKKIIGIDIDSKSFIYKTKKARKPKNTTTLKYIIDYSIKEIVNTIEKGEAVKNQLKNKIEIVPVGNCKKNSNNGFLFIKYEKTLYVYQYEINEELDVNVIFKSKYKITLKKEVLSIRDRFLSNNDIKEKNNLYFADVDFTAPFKSAVLPIVKEKFIIKKI